MKLTAAKAETLQENLMQRFQRINVETHNYASVKLDDDEFILIDKESHEELTSEDIIVEIVKSRKMLQMRVTLLSQPHQKIKLLNYSE